jgi:uncharacterized protein
MACKTVRSARESRLRSMARKRLKHSRLYSRNLLFVSTFAIFATLAALFSPSGLGTFFWLIPVIYLNYVLWQVFLSIHPMRLKQPPLTPQDATLSYEDVSLTTSDGLMLSAWYVPGRKRAAVILAHGLGASKVLMLNHARALAFDGYGVLLLDLRAHGDSQGDTVTVQQAANDIHAAEQYLLTRPDVDPGRIGALGVSLGAGAVLLAARSSEALRAVILEGLGPLCLADHGGAPTTLRRRVNYPFNWIGYRLMDWMSMASIPEGVMQALPHLWPRPVLLIAAGHGLEIHFNRLFFEAAREPKQLWEVPNAHHAAVFLFEPEASRLKIRSFFEQALLGN